MATGEGASRRALLTNRRLAALVATAIFLVLLVVFVADNFVVIEVRLIATRIQMRLAWALIIAFLAGAGGGLLIARLRR